MANNDAPIPSPAPTTKESSVSNYVLISAVSILLFVVAFVLILHLYAHWYIRRARRRDGRLRSTRFVFHISQPASEPASRGLDPAVLRNLPEFNRAAHSDPIECAVCLSEVEVGESGRTLPKCSHSFHIGCIDMWFYSHSTCPICRAVVELPPEPSPGSSSSDSKKSWRDFSVSVEIPSRNGSSNVEDESPSLVRSPVGRILSMILVRERVPPTSSLESPRDLEVGSMKG